ncbi:LysR family transcriptional regulator [Pseudomonas sp. UBA6310]|uniref:LysR family transcriptional regulator n=1 Tax=Pseudomonas sp. UBA6310 TaxID=1947327 RepID=UPI0025799F97|nr:LysR family transcriptional regulator [Pseudomonas sp. UBA6310]
MSQLEDMRIFVGVLDNRSFTAAADALGLSKQFVSRRVAALEERLGVRLLNRSTRKLDVTTLGHAYYERAKRILSDVDDVEQAIAQQSAAPRGSLRLSAPMSFGTLHLSTLIPEFLRRYPQVSIEMDLNDRAVDLLGEGYDMAVRIGVLADSSLIARQIAPLEIVTCCSPGYLAERGAPQTPADLRDHECLLYGHGKNVEWSYQINGKAQGFPLSGRLRVNNGELIRDAAIAGLGIACLPTFIIGEALADGRLVPLLQRFGPPQSKVYAVYPQHRQSSLVVKAFVDYLRDAFAA